MRQGRGSEATEAVLCLQAKKPLHSGSYEHRVPKTKNKTFFCMYVCLIQHRNWPLRSAILNAHGTNASPDGLCTRTHTSETFSCWFCGNPFRVDRARRGDVCLSSQGMVSYRSACPDRLIFEADSAAPWQRAPPLDHVQVAAVRAAWHES